MGSVGNVYKQILLHKGLRWHAARTLHKSLIKVTNRKEGNFNTRRTENLKGLYLRNYI